MTINKINNKIFVGVHETETPNKFDGYLGEGVWIDNPNTYNKGKKHLHNAILRHGVKAFVRITLRTFTKKLDALNLEAKIVTKEFVSRIDTYNTVIKSKRQIENDLDKNFINQYNKEGILLNTFNNTVIAGQKLDLDPKAIMQSIFKKKQYAGYYFLDQLTNIYEVLNNKQKSNKRPVYRYLKTGEYDKEYKSTIEAIRDVPSLSRHILLNSLINRRIGKDYYWSYIKTDNYFKIKDIV